MLNKGGPHIELPSLWGTQVQAKSHQKVRSADFYTIPDSCSVMEIKRGSNLYLLIIGNAFVTRNLKRELVVDLPSAGFFLTGLRPDVTQHALIIPKSVVNIRFLQSLGAFQDIIDYKFKDINLLQVCIIITLIYNLYIIITHRYK